MTGDRRWRASIVRIRSANTQHSAGHGRKAESDALPSDRFVPPPTARHVKRISGRMASAVSLRGGAAPAATGVMPKGAGRRGAKDGRLNLVALGSAAVVAIYAAGYVQTQSAADRFATASAVRRPGSSRAGVPQDDPRQAGSASPVADGVTELARPATGLADVPATAPALSKPAPMSAATSATAGRDEAGTSNTASTPIAAKSAKVLATNDSAKRSTATADAALSTVPSVVATPTTVVTQAAPGASAPVSSAPVSSEPLSSAPLASAPMAAAPVSTTAAAAPATTASQAAAATRRDGFFFGRGTSRHGDIEAMVEIKDGRIASAVISQCLTRYSCSWIAALPGQVVARQSADVDYVSGATQSANAFYYAIVEALKQAK